MKILMSLLIASILKCLWGFIVDKIIEINKVSVSFDNEEVLHDVSLDINKEDFVVLLGPSGCGKTTLLKIIAGYLKPQSGKVLKNNTLITKPDKSIGVVFQTPTLYPWLNVKENVIFGPKMSGKSPADLDKISEVYLKQVGLENYENKHTFELSGGMKQRLALARTLANNPEVILMDEPLASLDAFTRRSMQKLIRDLKLENNSTVFMITHDVDEALLLGNRILVMSKYAKNIVQEFTCDFYEKISSDKHFVYQKAYLELKSKIMDIIDNEKNTQLVN